MSSLPFPAKVLDAHSAVLGKTGAGKSSAMRVIVEHLLDQQKRVCIIDPKGDWWGTRLMADGKTQGYSLVTFGDFKGDYQADVPVTQEYGKHVAELITGGNRPAIIGFRGWFTAHMTKFWIEFAKTLFHTNEGELYLIIDEVQNFAPKGSLAGLEGKAGTGLHWTNRLLAEGRGLGINVSLGSQRPQKVHNDTLDGCETLVAMRTVHPASRGALVDWMKGSGDKESSAKILQSIGEMPRGQAWVWSPEIGFGPKHVTFPMFKTFDSFAPPQLQKEVKRRTWDDVDLEEVKTKLAAVIQEAEAKDPGKLRARIVQLEADNRRLQAGSGVQIETKTERVEVPVFSAADVGTFQVGVNDVSVAAESLAKTAEKIQTCIEQAKTFQYGEVRTKVHLDPANRGGRDRTVISRVPTPRTPPRIPPALPTQSPVDGEFKMTPKQQQILDAIAWYESIGNPSPSAVQVGAVALIDGSGGHFGNVTGPMSSAGLITRENQRLQITDRGRQLARMPEQIATLGQYHDILRQRVRKMKSAGGTTVRILDYIISRGGEDVTTAEIGAALPIDHTGGHFGNVIGPLSTAGLITRERGGIVHPTDVLFPPGLS